MYNWKEVVSTIPDLIADGLAPGYRKRSRQLVKKYNWNWLGLSSGDCGLNHTLTSIKD